MKSELWKKLLCVFASLREILRVQKLGKNHGGYHGETIDIRAVLRDIEAAAQRTAGRRNFSQNRRSGIVRAASQTARKSEPSEGRIYISTGIHGDEPAGPLAALKLIQENRWPANAEIFLLPCLNPGGFVLNTRGNADGIDLNRDYRHLESSEVRAHVRWLERQPKFDFYSACTKTGSRTAFTSMN